MGEEEVEEAKEEEKRWERKRGRKRGKRGRGEGGDVGREQEVGGNKSKRKRKKVDDICMGVPS